VAAPGEVGPLHAAIGRRSLLYLHCSIVLTSNAFNLGVAGLVRGRFWIESRPAFFSVRRAPFDRVDGRESI
jgi:hypothetical protein